MTECNFILRSLAGNCGFTIKVVAASFYEAFVTSVNNGKNYSSLQQISLVLFDKQVTEDFIKHFIVYVEKQSLSYFNEAASTGTIDVKNDFGAASSVHLETTDEFKENDKLTASGTNKCTICLETIINSHKLSCGHVFCKECIEEYLKKYKATCPVCGNVQGKLTGNQPKGDMKKTILKQPLCGYSNCNTIQITYDFPDGKQGVSIKNNDIIFSIIF